MHSIFCIICVAGAGGSFLMLKTHTNTLKFKSPIMNTACFNFSHWLSIFTRRYSIKKIIYTNKVNLSAFLPAESFHLTKLHLGYLKHISNYIYICFNPYRRAASMKTFQMWDLFPDLRVIKPETASYVRCWEQNNSQHITKLQFNCSY